MNSYLPLATQNMNKNNMNKIFFISLKWNLWKKKSKKVDMSRLYGYQIVFENEIITFCSYYRKCLLVTIAFYGGVEFYTLFNFLIISHFQPEVDKDLHTFYWTFPVNVKSVGNEPAAVVITLTCLVIFYSFNLIEWEKNKQKTILLDVFSSFWVEISL